MQQKLTQNKAKINYVGLLQSFARVLFFSIVFLKNVSVNTFFYIKNKIVPPPPPKPIPPAEPTLEELYKKDINFYKTMTPEVANSNINPTLYDPVLRKTLFTEENNPTEKYWRSQLLFEHTQRGNIIMYYDAFRMSFAYYSDEQIVSYQALYHAAMKYSVRFRCRNFFIDMETFPDNPMIEVLRKEDESLKTKTKKEPTNDNTKPKPKPQDNNPVFARLKNYKESGDAAKKQNKPKHPFSNKFVRIGKMCEFNILQRPPNKKIEAVNSLLFSDKPMSSVTDFFDDDDETLSLKMPISGTEDDSFMNPSETPKEIPEQKDVPINPFSGDQPKMTSYQLFKMMKKNQEKNEGAISL